jgi:putative transferase (TIGR04331 family)
MKSLFNLSIKLRQLPRRYFQFDDDVFESKLKFKERIIKIDFSCDNDFERYLSTHLFKHIPYAYIEGYPNLKEISNKFNMYGRIIFTSNAHFSNDLFKVWCAEQVSNRGSKLFISLHGGAIPSLMSAFSRHEDMVSDKKIVWHKPLNQKQARLPPNKFLVKNKVRAKK